MQVIQLSRGSIDQLNNAASKEGEPVNPILQVIILLTDLIVILIFIILMNNRLSKLKLSTLARVLLDINLR